MSLEQSPKTVAEYLEIGKKNFQLGYFEWAKESLDMAVKMGCVNEEVHRLRGLVHRELHEFRAAIEDFNCALAYSPDRVDYYEIRINLWFGVGNTENALADTYRLLAIDSKNSFALAQAGEIYFYDIRDFDCAQKYFTKYTETINPGDIVTYDLGLLRYFQGNYNGALAEFAKCITTNLLSTFGELLIFEFLTRMRSNSQPENSALGHFEIGDEAAYPDFIVLFFQDRFNLTQVWKAIHFENETRLVERMKFLACFFLGEYFLISGDRRKAKYFLRRAAKCFDIEDRRIAIFQLFAAKSLSEIP